MTREFVINQLVYYLNYGFISKDLQEDIKEVLLKKKDTFVLERLLDSVEYELNKNIKNKYKDNIPKETANNLIINKNKIIKNDLNLKPKTKKTVNIKNRNDIKQDSIVFIENNQKKELNLVPASLKLFNNKKKR